MDYKEEYNELCKKRMKDILNYFITYCDNHGLRYFCSQGTALGVMRHHGFIPWDDDVDVMMPRPDYEKLMKIYSDDFSNSYELVTPYNTPNYYLPFAKIIDKKSTIIERRKIPCTLGLFIDIFPLDGMPEDEVEINSLSDTYCKYRQRLTEVSSREGIIDFLYFLLTGQFGRVKRNIKYLFKRTSCRKDILNKLKEIGDKYPFDSADRVSVEDSDTIYHPFPKDWLDPPVLMAFDELKVAMPCKSDDYLKHAYGNYMQYPPVEQRVNNHMDALFYFNLNERKEHHEVKNEILKEYFHKRVKAVFSKLNSVFL